METQTKGPTPWYWEEDAKESFAGGKVIFRTLCYRSEFGPVQVGFNGVVGAPGRTDANAAFVVRACNAHEEMVEALTLLKEAVNVMADEEHCLHDEVLRNLDAVPWGRLNEIARAALAKARGEA